MNILAMTFSEAMTTPFWEFDKDLLASPMGAAGLASIWGAWKLWQTYRKFAANAPELVALLKAIRAAIPVILEALKKTTVTPPAPVKQAAPAEKPIVTP